MPILLPPGASTAAVLAIVDGLILTGGGDIAPTEFGRAWHPTIYGVQPERDSFELALARLSLDRTTPVLGICRGAQVLTVASGGDLILDLPSQVGLSVIHSSKSKRATHSVEIEPDSQLAQIVGATTLSVPSSHHQAARHAPTGWRLVARAPDGVIEAIEREGHPWMIAVQWHPEMAPDDPHQQRIFEAFVAAARIQRDSDSY